MKRSKMNRSTMKNMNKSNLYIFSQKIYKNNNKVIENITQELKNNKLYTRGYINGKKINKTSQIK
jgi:hypothetical protein